MPPVQSNITLQSKLPKDNTPTFVHRERFTVAQINAGVTLINGLTGYKFRLHDAAIIAVGGAATTGTSVDINATRAGSAVILVSFKTAGMGQSVLLRAGTATNGVLLVDGASFTECDVATAITVAKIGTDFTVATSFDLLVTYSLTKG